MTKDDGGPAFPSNAEHIEYQKDGTLKPLGFSGMSLRDWFAGMALSGMTADTQAMRGIQQAAKEGGVDFKNGVALTAYALADAMLKERNRD